MTESALSATHASRNWERVAVYIACTLLSVIAALWIGKDAGWDQYNYHVYAGYTAFDTRLDQDFMPASIQSYLNRLSFVPFVTLAMTNMGSAYVAAVLAAIQSIALWCCYELALMLPRPPGASGRAASLGAVLLAALCPIYVIQVGSPANDLLTAVPVLMAWVCMFKAAGGSSSTKLIVAAGLLLGIASGLKLTHGIFALASLALFVFIRPFKLRDLVIWGCAGLIGFGVVDGWWAYALWRQFGNPVFPMLNGLFKSPDFGLYNIGTSTRWIMHNVPDIVLLPFRMALPEANRYVELTAPDIRYAVAFVSMALAIVAATLGRLRRPSVLILAGSSAFFLLCWALWQITSGQGRYLAPVALAVGPFLLSWIWMASRSARLVVYSLLVTITVQFVGTAFGTTLGRAELSWEGPWVQIEVPAKLRDEPHLILTGTTQTFSAIVPFVDRRSSLINIGGQTIIQPDTPAAARLMKLVEKFGENIVYIDRDPAEAVHGDVQLFKYGLELGTECELLKTPQYFEGVVGKDEAGQERPPIVLSVCPVHRRAPPGAAYYKERLAVRSAADAVMRACPKVFSPDPGEIDGANGRWRVNFTTRDAEILVLDGQVMLSNFFHPFYSPIGTLQTWSAGNASLTCKFYPLSKSTDLSLYFTADEINGLRGRDAQLAPLTLPTPSSTDAQRPTESKK